MLYFGGVHVATAKTRQYGNGSIFQRKDGRWVAEYTSPEMTAGKGKTKYFTGKTELEVKRKLREFKNNPLNFSGVTASKATVESYFMNWLQTYKRPTIKDGTYDRLDSVIRTHIAKYFDGFTMGQVTTDDCQKMITKLSENGLSYNSIKKIYDTMNGCFKYAVLKEEINKNPMSLVGLPSKHLFEAKEIRWLTAEEEKVFLSELDRKAISSGSYWYGYRDAFILDLNTGLREGELIALDWSDIDLENKFINVNKTAVIVKDRDKSLEFTGGVNQVIQDTPKTKAGARQVPLNKKALAALMRLKERAKDSEYVFPTSTGARAMCTALQKQFRLIVKRCGFNDVTVHSLRHTFATRLFELGADVKTVSTILGHSSTAITYNTYIHIIKEKKTDIVSLLD